LKYTSFCKFDLAAGTREDAIKELLDLFSFGEQKNDLLRGALDVREQVGATVVHQGIALPHCRSILVDRIMVAVGRSRKGILWPTEKVHTVILFISPVKPMGPEEHAAFLSHVAMSIRDSGEAIVSAPSEGKLLELLDFERED
jgi:nitrogen PTS system EIIA component